MSRKSAIVCLFVAVAGCSQFPAGAPIAPATTKSALPWPKDWFPYLGKTVTLDGVAEKWKVGPLLHGDEGAIWIDWPEEVLQGAYGKRLRVTGTVSRRDDLPVFIPKPGVPIPCGIALPPGSDLEKAKWRFLLSNARWEILE